jgi:hypothetical protein
MIRRRYVVPALVLGSTLMVAEAHADFVIPATAGQPGIYSFVNNPNPRGLPVPPPAIYWLWFSDVFIWRTTSPPAPLEWDIPLVFNGRAGHNNKWGVSVMVSGDTECFAQWWPDDVPGSGPIGTVPTSRPDAGSLLLTTPATCFDGADCITSFATVQVSCMVPAGGFVGPVSYWIIDMGP